MQEGLQGWRGKISTCRMHTCSVIHEQNRIIHSVSWNTFLVCLDQKNRTEGWFEHGRSHFSWKVCFLLFVVLEAVLFDRGWSPRRTFDIPQGLSATKLPFMSQERFWSSSRKFSYASQSRLVAALQCVSSLNGGSVFSFSRTAVFSFSFPRPPHPREILTRASSLAS